MAFSEKVKRFLEWLEHGKTVVDILVALGLGKVLQILIVRFASIPPMWVAPIWLLLSAGVLWLALTFFKRKATPPQSEVQNVSNALVAPTPQFDFTRFFRLAYYSSLTEEAERNIRAAANANQPNDREGFLAKLIGVGVISYVYDIVWAYIYKSQLLMLLELNRRGGLMPMAEAKPYYDKAAAEYPEAYSHYSFDQWLSYLKEQQLLLQHPSDMLEITIRGRDFLTYLTHSGRYADDRKF